MINNINIDRTKGNGASPSIIIEPSKGWVPFQLTALWEYRELLYFLIWKDLKVRYKQTVLGILWVILQPFLTMVLFTIFFGNLAGVESESGIPYPVLTFTALLPWQLFAGSISHAGNSLVNNQQLITKVYFPKLLLPISGVINSVIDFFVAFIVLAGLMIYYGITPSVMIFLLPGFIFLAALSALAVSLWLAALNVKYRDIRYTIPFITQFWLFATPVVYPVSIIPSEWKIFYGLNPMVGVVEGFRWALFKSSEPPDVTIFVSVIIIIILLISGLYYFRMMEKTFADVV